MDRFSLSGSEIELLARSNIKNALKDLGSVDLGSSNSTPTLLGNPLASVFAIKGELSARKNKNSSRGFLDEPDGQALEKTLSSMGYPPNSLCGVQLSEFKNKTGFAANDLALVIETVDPLAIITLDKRAAFALEEAFPNMQRKTSLPSGEAITILQGRMVIALDNLETSLSNMDAKRRAWAALKTLKHIPRGTF